MGKQTEVVEITKDVQAEIEKNIFLSLPPYVTAEKWAELVGKTTSAIKRDLQRGHIARYQPVAGGIVYVNVIKENQRAEAAADY